MIHIHKLALQILVQEAVVVKGRLIRIETTIEDTCHRTINYPTTLACTHNIHPIIILATAMMIPTDFNRTPKAAAGHQYRVCRRTCPITPWQDHQAPTLAVGQVEWAQFRRSMLGADSTQEQATNALGATIVDLSTVMIVLAQTMCLMIECRQAWAPDP